MDGNIRWGILGSGSIAATFAGALVGRPRVTLTAAGANPQVHTFSLRGRGYSHMAEAFGELLAGKKTESPIMSHTDSVPVMETLDTLRGRWGLRYPLERA